MLRRLSISTGLLWGLVATLALTGCTPGRTRDKVALSPTEGTAPVRPESSHAIECARKRAALLRDLSDRGAPYHGRAPNPVDDTLADTDVLHYHLEIEVFPEREEIAGTNTMTVMSLVEGLREFTFRLHGDFEITSATINGTTPVAITEVSLTTRRAKLDRPYDAGKTFTLTIAYQGTPPSMGFGSVQFEQHEGADIVYSFSCPYFAYTWWPCKDGDAGAPGDNCDKATVELAVIAPEQLRTVSNGLLQGIDTLDGDRRRYRWASDYPIATYLVCFSSTNYVTWTANYEHDSGTMPVEFNLYPETDTPENRQLIEQSLEMLDTFGRVFGPYPFLDEKFGIYQFEFGGGMEHQTNVGQGSFTPSLTAHELAHQWWGDTVTCRTWHDVWLNEGFATYAEALWEEFKPGSSGAEALHAWMAERRPGSVDDSVYVYDTSDVWRVFNGDYSYCKGAWVLHQLRHVVGDAAFFEILTRYRKTFENCAPTTADFAAVAALVADQDLSWFFDQWVYGKGAPEYRYGWETEQIDGQHYLRLYIDQVQDASWGTFRMPLDVRIDYADGSEMRVVLNDTDPQHFVIPIPKAATGVALDPLNWVLHTSLEEQPYVAEPDPKTNAAVPASE